MATAEIVTAAYVNRLPVVRQVLSVRVRLGVTNYFTVELHKSGAVIATARVYMGNPALYSSAAAWASSGSLDPSGARFAGNVLAPQVAAVVWFPGWTETISETDADVYLQFAATGVGAEECFITAVTHNVGTNTGVTFFAPVVVNPYIEGFDYQLTANSGSGQWIGDLSLIDRQATLNAFNAERDAAPVVLAPTAPSAGVAIPQEAVPATTNEELFEQVAVIESKLDILIELVSDIRRCALTQEQMLAVNSNVVMLGNNSSRVADATLAVLGTIDGKIATRNQRVLENVAVNLFAGMVTG